MQRDIVQFVSNKLQGAWSAYDFGRHINAENLQAILPRFDRLEPLIRVRLLISLLSLDEGTKESLKVELQLLEGYDKEEWVSTTAYALGTLQVPLDLNNLSKGSSLVRKTLSEMGEVMATANVTVYRPLEELYMSTTSCEADPLPQHNHFVSREGTSFQEMYAQNQTSTNTKSESAFSTAELALSYLATRSEIVSTVEKPATLGKTKTATSSYEAQSQSSVVSTSTERRGMEKVVSVKSLDVEEVKQINRPAKSTSSRLSTARRETPSRPSSPAEDGEIEDGEYFTSKPTYPKRQKF